MQWRRHYLETMKVCRARFTLSPKINNHTFRLSYYLLSSSLVLTYSGLQGLCTVGTRFMHNFKTFV